MERIRRPGSLAATHTSKGATETGSSRLDNATTSLYEKGVIIILFVGGEWSGAQVAPVHSEPDLLHRIKAERIRQELRGNQNLSHGDDNRQRDNRAQYKQSHQIDKIQRNAGLQNQYANL